MSGEEKTAKENRRDSKRITLQVVASYLENNRQDWQDCSVIDVSNNGLGILLYLKEAIQVGTKLEFVVNIVPKVFQETGTVMWSKKLPRDTSFNGALGIKLDMMDDTAKNKLFQYACSNFLMSDKQWEEEKKLL